MRSVSVIMNCLSSGVSSSRSFQNDSEFVAHQSW